MNERVIVVGAGGIAGSWFPALLAEKLNVVAVVDLRLESAQKRIDEFKLTGALAATSLPEALAKVQADFVVDLTIPAAHADVTCTALQAGLHVIGEKPMADSLANARRMVATATQHNRTYIVSQSRRWDAQHEAIRSAIASGAIGTVTSVCCDFFLAAHFGGFRDTMESPLILDMSIHHFDMARMFSGLDAQRVWCEEYNPHGSWYQGNVAALASFELSNGARFMYRGSWCAEGCHTSWNGDWRITGTKGTIIYASDQPPTGQIVSGDEGFMRPLSPLTIPVPALPAKGQHGGLRELLAAIRTGTRSQCDCRDNFNSLAMVFAAMESSRAGGKVAVETL
ncbi:MAG: Gfo/Idh/MocA family oxidoreductase [Phycisphaerae bacterium]